MEGRQNDNRQNDLIKRSLIVAVAVLSANADCFVLAAKECVQDIGIEVGASTVSENLQALFDWECLLVGTR